MAWGPGLNRKGGQEVLAFPLSASLPLGCKHTATHSQLQRGLSPRSADMPDGLAHNDKKNNHYPSLSSSQYIFHQKISGKENSILSEKQFGKPGMVAPASNPSAWKLKAGGSQVQG